jgi:hypothetical protein
MKFVALVAVLGLVATASAAQAAEIRLEIKRADSHPWEHPLNVPVDSRRAMINFEVTAYGKEFVCAANDGAELRIDFSATYDSRKEWAGASPEPYAASVRIPVGQPAMNTMSYKLSPDVGLGIFWGENRPKTDATVDYELTVRAAWPDACLPTAEIQPVRATLTAVGDDILDDPTNETCEADDPLCMTEPTIEPKGDSPGPGAVLSALLVTGLAVFALRRRRQA